jgi:Arm DNA-binding domain
MARREGFEPTTPRFVVLGRLNPLSIRSISQKTALDEGDMSGQRKRELPFNALAVNKAAALNGKTTEYSIEGARGLWLAVTPKGTATYVFRYDAPLGRVRSQLKKKIGRRDAVKLADARRVIHCLSGMGGTTCQMRRKNKGPVTRQPMYITRFL